MIDAVRIMIMNTVAKNTKRNNAERIDVIPQSGRHTVARKPASPSKRPAWKPA